MRPPKALLLAAGPGTRLRPLTDRVPKCLVPIAGRPLLDYWLMALADAGVRQVTINTHHLRDQVRDHITAVNARGGQQIAEAFEPRLLGSAGTVSCNRAFADDCDELLLIYADNFSDVDLRAMLAYHRSHGDPVTMLLFRASDPRACGIVQLDDEGHITDFHGEARGTDERPGERRRVRGKRRGVSRDGRCERLRSWPPTCWAGLSAACGDGCTRAITSTSAPPRRSRAPLSMRGASITRRFIGPGRVAAGGVRRSRRGPDRARALSVSDPEMFASI